MARVNLGQLRTALGVLTRLPFGEEQRSSGDLSLPLVLAAGLIGLDAALVGGLCWWLGGPVAGALLGGLLVPTALWWLTRGRGLQSLYAVVQGGGTGLGRADEVSLRMAAFHALLLLKMLCTGLLVGAGAALWLFIAWLLAGVVLADEWASREGSGTAGRGSWLVVGVGCILAGGLSGQFVGPLFLTVLVWLGLPVARRWLAPRCELPPTAFSWLLVEVAETLVLLLAVLIVFAPR
ncbi:MAG: hypothetical protein HN849_28985 [Victivallales bacterium]|nr:hypothetical protein [Victivallales bacterium]